MKGMGQFNPEYYLLHRPFYPPQAFAGFAASLRARGFKEPFELADIGCGTGHSTASILQAGVLARVLGVEPDPGMLEAAQGLVRSLGLSESVRFSPGSGEASGLAGTSVDGVLVGSAFHWMDPVSARSEFVRILRPRGIVHLFEYQFPKAIRLQELNDWIRRQFNLHWKAPGQVPRGDFGQVTAAFKDHPAFEKCGEGRPPMVQELTAGELSGLLLSQSRLLHFESTLPESEKAGFRDRIRAEVDARWGNTRESFDFRLAWIRFAKRE